MKNHILTLILLLTFNLVGAKSITPPFYDKLKADVKLSKIAKIKLLGYSLNDSSIRFEEKSCGSCSDPAEEIVGHNYMYSFEYQINAKKVFSLTIDKKSIFDKYFESKYMEDDPALPDFLKYDPINQTVSFLISFKNSTSNQGKSIVYTFNLKGKFINAFIHFNGTICGSSPLFLKNGTCLTCQGFLSADKSKLVLRYDEAPVQEYYQLSDTTFLVVKDNFYAKSLQHQKEMTQPGAEGIPLTFNSKDSENVFIYGKSGHLLLQTGFCLIRRSTEYMGYGQPIYPLKIIGFYNRFNNTVKVFSSKNPLNPSIVNMSKSALNKPPLNVYMMPIQAPMGIEALYFDKFSGKYLGHLLKIPIE